ncbi:DUF1801 domain-containing protein [Paraflavitalea sp. CAU 1676]|uniref:DUF1801 domain-containing protein n=1 Tax=Paraflavitalea sp. CAU 1676 TaxID=3032598 RepID=UPI0023DBBE1D|nr:DUF1801 domain-containing protein [Paraflavitalea sp. CAU 1676]MDF2187858.1 DUF1801 domain-containing protein [Paraflavitalea sp. CAU 1676]
MAKQLKKASTTPGKTTKKPAAYVTVDEYLQQLEGSLLETLQVLREVILSTDKLIGEQIKWNSPAFYYTGAMKPFDPKEYKRDIAVVNIYRKEYVLLVFPTGARINDTSGLLEGNYPDGRRMVKIQSVDDLKTKEKVLQQVIKKWLEGVE